MATTYLQAHIDAYTALRTSDPSVPATLWAEQIPSQEQSSYPRVQLDMLGDTPVQALFGETMTTYRSRYTVFATRLQDVESLLGDGGAIREWFHPDRIQIDGRTVKLWRLGYTVGMSPEHTRDGLPIYFGSLEHMAEVL